MASFGESVPREKCYEPVTDQGSAPGDRIRNWSRPARAWHRLCGAGVSNKRARIHLGRESISQKIWVGFESISPEPWIHSGWQCNNRAVSRRIGNCAELLSGTAPPNLWMQQIMGESQEKTAWLSQMTIFKRTDENDKRECMYVNWEKSTGLGGKLFKKYESRDQGSPVCKKNYQKILKWSWKISRSKIEKISDRKILRSKILKILLLKFNFFQNRKSKIGKSKFWKKVTFQQ